MNLTASSSASLLGGFSELTISESDVCNDRQQTNFRCLCAHFHTNAKLLVCRILTVDGVNLIMYTCYYEFAYYSTSMLSHLHAFEHMHTN